MGDLMSPDGLESVRRRRSRDDAVERFRWPLIVVGALGVAVANYVGLIFVGVPTVESLIIAGGLWVLIVMAYVALSIATRGRVVPLRSGEDEAVDLDAHAEFAARAEAAEEAARRNQRRDDSGEYWRPEPLANGRWGLRRRWVPTRRQRFWRGDAFLR